MATGCTDLRPFASTQWVNSGFGDADDRPTRMCAKRLQKGKLALSLPRTLPARSLMPDSAHEGRHRTAMAAMTTVVQFGYDAQGVLRHYDPKFEVIR
jgi:hypothetical protein